MKKNIFLITTSLITQLSFSQVLLSEDFNSYPTGHLNTDYTGNIPGLGGWIIKRSNNASATAMVTPETSKGNVVTFTTTTNSVLVESIMIQQNIGIVNALWHNRTAGNNVLKFEYEVFGTGYFVAEGIIWDKSTNFINLRFFSTWSYRIETHTLGSANPIHTLQSYTSATFPYNTWHKVEIFFDYNAKKVYYYLPNLNLFKVDNIHSLNLQDNISLSGTGLKMGAVVKYDNIKLTALPNVPNYILSATEIVSAKFNMYPNPATSVVTITNNENMLVDHVTIYDNTGKELKTQNFNNESLIQLNVENLASGTYMLHIGTNAGLAVKKLVKK